MTSSAFALVIDRSAPIAPMLDRRKLAALSGVNRPEKLVAMKAERPGMCRPCSISASTSVVGSPQAWPKTMRSPGGGAGEIELTDGHPGSPDSPNAARPELVEGPHFASCGARNANNQDSPSTSSGRAEEGGLTACPPAAAAAPPGRDRAGRACRPSSRSRRRRGWRRTDRRLPAPRRLPPRSA